MKGGGMKGGGGGRKQPHNVGSLQNSNTIHSSAGPILPLRDIFRKIKFLKADDDVIISSQQLDCNGEIL